MGKMLSKTKAIKQFDEVHQLFINKGRSFKAKRVEFSTGDGEDISINKVEIQLIADPYANTRYYKIHILWEEAEHDLSDDQIQILNLLYSRSASTNYQKMKFKSSSIIIENNDIKITIKL